MLGLWRRLALGLCAIDLAWGFCQPAFADASSYPVRPITLTVPVAAGGLSDMLGRVLAEDLGKRLHGTIIVNNRVGAGGTVGMAAVARMNPDGYSVILVFQGPATVAPFLYRELGYDTLKDFVPIGMVGNFQNAVVVNNGLPVKTTKDLIDLSKQRNGSLNFGSAGVGSTSHLTGELFERKAGVKLQHVPYRGEAPALADLAGRRTAVVFSTLAAAKPLADVGKVRIIGIAAKERSHFAPQILTVAESGLPGFVLPGWYGLLAPAGTPVPIVQQWQHALEACLNDPAVKEKLYTIGIEPAYMNGADFAAWLRKDSQQWQAVIKESGIRPE